MLADAQLLEINGTFFVELIAFLVVLGVLSKWAFPAIMRAAEQRQDAIVEALKVAEENRAEAQKSLEGARKDLDEARVQARDIIERARKEARGEAEEIRVKAHADGEALVERARVDITAERDRAIQELRTQTGALVVATAGKVLGQAIDDKAHQRLIEESLSKVAPDGSGRG